MMWNWLTGIDWTKVAPVVGSIAPVTTISIALYTVKQWKRTLRRQKSDECISAARYLRGAVGRYVSIKSRLGRDEDANREMWDGLRAFDQAYVVAQWYHKKTLTEKMLDKVFSTVTDLSQNLNSSSNNKEGALEKEAVLQGLLDNIIKELRK
jgi:hypothetical protein